MSSTASNYEFKLSASFKAKISIDAVVKLLGEDIFREELISFPRIEGPSQGFAKLTLIDINQDILSVLAFLLTDSGHFDAFNGILQGDFIHPPGTPTANVASGSSSILKSFGKDKFLTIKIDVTNCILSIFGFPGIEGRHCVPGLGEALCVDVHVLDLFGQLDFSMQDVLKFEGVPDVTVQLSNGELHTFKAGSSLNLTMPAVSPGAQANTLTVSPEFSLANSNTMSHESYLALDPAIKFQPFSLDVCVDIDIASGCIGFHPFDDINLWDANFLIDFLSPNPKTFPLPGLNVVATDALISSDSTVSSAGALQRIAELRGR